MAHSSPAAPPSSGRHTAAGDGQPAAASEAALQWFRAQVPERTLHNWQRAAARLVALDLRERARAAPPDALAEAGSTLPAHGSGCGRTKGQLRTERPPNVSTDTRSSHPTPHTTRGHRDPAHPPPAPARDRLARAARRSLRFNALTGSVSGPVLALGAGVVAPLVGLEQYAAAVPVVPATGVGLVLFAALLLLWVARRPVPPPPGSPAA